MGSEFAYEDVSSEEVERYTYQYLREEGSGEGSTCHAYERYPVDEGSGYSKHIVYADTQHYPVQRVEYFDRKTII